MSEIVSGQKFSVDISGLLEALTEQFPEPLLCVRELIQNAADAGAQKITVDVAYDGDRQLLRLSVTDDGRGMSSSDIEAYLTIGFSDKNKDIHRGRFGIGKLSPYALGIVRMVVETCDGHFARRITFSSDGSGAIREIAPRARGTVVRVYKRCEREVAEDLATRTTQLVSTQCGSLSIPLYVNGINVNRDIGLPTNYSLRFNSPVCSGELGIQSEPIRLLMGGSIVLESGAPILGPSISYVLDSSRLSPTLSRNAVRRDNEFETLLREAQSQLPALTEQVAKQLADNVTELRTKGKSIERELSLTDRAALEWLRGQLLDPENEAPLQSIKQAPVLETADGNLVSLESLVQVIRKDGRLPISRVPRTKEEIGGFVDRGVPVLLLYRDLEDFLEKQKIPCIEVDGQDDGVEVEPQVWSRGEAALARRILPSSRPNKGATFVRVAAIACSIFAVAMLWYTFDSQSRRFGEEPTAQVKLHKKKHEIVDIEESLEVHIPAESIRESRNASVNAAMIRPPSKATKRNQVLTILAAIIAVLSGTAGFGVLYRSYRRRRAPITWVQEEIGTPLTAGATAQRRWDIVHRALLHPIDFFIARTWSVRSAGQKSLSASSKLAHYRELTGESIIRSGVRLQLDLLQIGFVDLVSTVGEPHDGRVLLMRDRKVLLNRNHPTVRDLIEVASIDEDRARILLDILLATDPHLSKETDPRQVEWDLLNRAEKYLEGKKVS
ncbi:MAG: ATP-binding protein [Myxococcota bacterium]|nr:ATP-binding protein [Myxococcota bacterium]